MFDGPNNGGLEASPSASSPKRISKLTASEAGEDGGIQDTPQSMKGSELNHTHLSIDINDSVQLEAQGLKRV